MADSAETSVTYASPYLKQVRVRDYPPMHDAAVDFKPGLNIIIGKNGAGKTRFLTLLNSLANLEQEHFSGAGCNFVIGGQQELNVLVELPAEVEDASAAVAQYVGDTALKLVMRSPQAAQSVEARTIDDFIRQQPLDFHLSYAVVFIRHGLPASGLPIVDEGAELLLEKRGFFVKSTNGSRRLHEIESRLSQAMLRTIVTTIRNGFTVMNGVAIPPLTAEAASTLIRQVMGVYVDYINYYLPLYSPLKAVRCGESFEVYYNSFLDEYIIKGLAFEYQMVETWLPFSALSDGTKRLFYLLTEMIGPASVSLNKQTGETRTTTEHRIILLEEPELGVHPHQLHLVLNLIREVARAHQIILTTHAPQVLDMLGKKELDRIKVCEVTAKKGTQFRKLSRTKQNQARIYMQETGFLSDYWRYSYLEGNGVR